MHKISKDKAFTLAEVLITLTIVGVVATLVIPTIIQNTQKTAYVQGLRKAYGVISQASAQIRMDNAGSMIGALGTFDGDNNTMMNVFCTKLSCARTCHATTNPGVCWHSGTTSWHNLHNDSGSFNPANMARAVLSDGSMLAFSLVSYNCADTKYTRSGNEGCAEIFVDVNGLKGPNTFGRDIFGVVIAKYITVVQGSKWTNADYGVWTGNCDPTDSSAWSGSGCAGRILLEGSMNY